MKAYRALCYPAQVAVIVLLGAALVAWGAWSVNVVHERRAFRQRECAAKVEVLKARNAFLRQVVEPEDKCVALAVLSGESL